MVRVKVGVKVGVKVTRISKGDRNFTSNMNMARRGFAKKRQCYV
jgi:hypothetical protein